MSAPKRSKAAAEPKASRKMVVFVDELFFVPGHGFRVAIVVEGEAGYRWTGTWPYTGAHGETMPWFWGPTIEAAREAAAQHNELLGITPEEATRIIGRSMALGARR